MVEIGGSGGTMVRHLHTTVQDRLFAAALQKDRVMIRPGTKAVNVLRVAANVVDGETVTIGPDVYEVDIINTDTNVNTLNTAAGALDATSNPVNIFLASAPVTPVAVGDLVRVDNEIFKILRKNSTTDYVAARARCGTVAATHVQNSDVFQSNGAPTTTIPVGLVTTLTPAVFTPALAAEIINATAGGERATSKASTIYGTHTAASLQSGAEMLLEAVSAGVLATATTETLAGANNVWSAATMAGGSAAAVKKYGVQERVPTATEVALGFINFTFDFTPAFVQVYVRATATGIVTAWNGGWTISGGRVRLDNAGATDWATTDTVKVSANE